MKREIWQSGLWSWLDWLTGEDISEEMTCK